MKKFLRKGTLFVETPKLNPEILAYMFKNCDSNGGQKYFLDFKTDISSTLVEDLGNAGKLMASLYYQHSIMRRAFIISGVDEKYRVAKEVRNNDRFFWQKFI